MAFSLHYAAASDIGLGRYKNNQDSGYAGPHLLVVADGMGGAAGGDVASSTVIGELVPLDADGPGPDAARDLVTAIQRANDAMNDQVQVDPSLQGMGATCTALLRTGNHLVLAHVGDSRAYLLADGAMEQLTHDHTFVQRLIDTGQITEDEAERHPQRSVILRVVGHMEGDEVDVSTFTPVPGQRLLLCSDGLPRVVSADTIQEALAAGEQPEQTADRLVQLALRAGGPDNITVIVADVVDSHQVPSTRPQVVGAAASVRNIPTAARGSAAARAAALTAGPEAESAEEDDDVDARRPGWVRPTLAGLVALALVAAGLFGVNRWLQKQYYVASQDGMVTLYQGLNTTLGPLHLSHAERRTGLRVDSLSEANRNSAAKGFGRASLTEAEGTIRRLAADSTQCRGTAATPTPTTPSGSASTVSRAPSASSTPRPTSTPTGTASTSSPAATMGRPATTTPSPGTTISPTVTRPEECDG